MCPMWRRCYLHHGLKVHPPLNLPPPSPPLQWGPEQLAKGEWKSEAAKLNPGWKTNYWGSSHTLKMDLRPVVGGSEWMPSEPPTLSCFSCTEIHQQSHTHFHTSKQHWAFGKCGPFLTLACCQPSCFSMAKRDIYGVWPVFSSYWITFQFSWGIHRD